MTIRAIILSSTLLLCLPLFAQEKNDVLVMKNGDRFTCEIKGLSAGVLSVKLSYVDGTISVQWSQVAHLESNRLFLVQTESGAVYTGKLSTSGVSEDPPIRIQLAATPNREVEIAQNKVIKLSQTSENFWSQFNGAVNTGSLYSKGNQSAQYNVSSQVEYDRERWSAQASFNSSFASNSGAGVSTRNQIDLSSMRLLRWNNWFYAGSASFLQSSVQEINLQITLSGGVGRYLKTPIAPVSIYSEASAGKTSATHKSRPIRTRKISQLASFLPRSKPSNSKKQIWISRPLSFRQSPIRDVSISMRTPFTTSSCSAISRGTFLSMEAGTVALLQHCRAATTVPVQDLVGPLAIGKSI